MDGNPIPRSPHKKPTMGVELNIRVPSHLSILDNKRSQRVVCLGYARSTICPCLFLKMVIQMRRKGLSFSPANILMTTKN